MIHNNLITSWIILIIYSPFSFPGITMIVSGAADYVDTEDHKDILEGLPDTEGIDIGLIVGGAFILLLGVALSVLYIKVADWRRLCNCSSMSKKQGLARQLQGGGNGAGPVALNPSTDPLVSHTQYAPVSEIPMKSELEERHTLMVEAGGEENERMLDVTAGSDSRIVLRPIGHVEDA